MKTLIAIVFACFILGSVAQDTTNNATVILDDGSVLWTNATTEPYIYLNNGSIVDHNGNLVEGAYVDDNGTLWVNDTQNNYDTQDHVWALQTTPHIIDTDGTVLWTNVTAAPYILLASGVVVDRDGNIIPDAMMQNNGTLLVNGEPVEYIFIDGLREAQSMVTGYIVDENGAWLYTNNSGGMDILLNNGSVVDSSGALVEGASLDSNGDLLVNGVNTSYITEDDLRLQQLIYPKHILDANGTWVYTNLTTAPYIVLDDGTVVDHSGAPVTDATVDDKGVVRINGEVVDSISIMDLRIAQANLVNQLAAQLQGLETANATAMGGSNGTLRNLRGH